LAEHENVGFVFLDDHPHATFLHGTTSVPVQKGVMVIFPGMVPHHTVVHSQQPVRLLGPFALWDYELSLVGDTPEPSTTPSEMPTATPSGLPTAAPSKIPTAIPTTSPRENPTATPTSSPSEVPTKNSKGSKGSKGKKGSKSKKGNEGSKKSKGSKGSEDSEGGDRSHNGVNQQRKHLPRDGRRLKS
jgi:hypothetical protein